VASSLSIQCSGRRIFHRAYRQPSRVALEQIADQSLGTASPNLCSRSASCADIFGSTTASSAARSRDMATPMAAYPTFRPTAQRQNREPNDISQFRSRAGISCAKSMPCLASLLASARREPRLLSHLLPSAACWTRCHPAPGCSPGHPRHLRARIPLRRGHPTGSGGKLAATCFI
jgi:hypothetical protein